MKKIDLEFRDWNDQIANKIGKSEWITVFSLDKAHSDVDQGCFFGVLMDKNLVEDSLKNYSWEIHSIDGGKPGFMSYYENKEEKVEYYRYSESGIEQLVYWRTFPGMEDRYYEISEEFRLFHDLYEKDNKFYHFDDNGDRHLVAEINEHEIRIKFKFLKEFISAKNMVLTIFFEFMRFSEKSIQDLGFKFTETTKSGVDFIYSLLIRDLDGFGGDKRKAQGWILGKKIIPGIKNYKPSVWGNDERNYEEFIIGIDYDGNELLHTSNEESLSNYFGKNPGSPHYLTPIYFKKDVLNKYYSKPNEYEVSDGIVRRTGFWSLRIDNNHSEYVNAFLGDLGKLNHKEQLYWKSFNIYSEVGISKANWERSFEGKFSDPNEPDLYFKYAFNRFQKNWKEKFDWDLFKPLNKEDQHHFKSLRIPLSQDQKEFDEQILSLTKILIDSLNEKKLKKEISIELKDNAKGIDKLEAFLISKGVGLPEMIKFLRDLQELRSTGSAHRKSSNYQKTKEKYGLNDDNFREVFQAILIKSVMIFNTLGKLMIKENYTQQDV